MSDLLNESGKKINKSGKKNWETDKEKEENIFLVW